MTSQKFFRPMISSCGCFPALALALLLLFPKAAVCLDLAGQDQTPQTPDSTGKPKNGFFRLADVDFTITGASVRDREYLPDIKGYIYTWREESYQVELTRQWDWDLITRLGWVRADILQENDFFNDIDFAFRRQGPFVEAEYFVNDMVLVEARVAEEKFFNRSATGFYQLDDHRLYTGYMYATYRNNGFRAHLSYDRQRDLEPVYDPLTNLAALDVVYQQFYGIETGWKLDKQWDVAASIFYEEYDDSDLNQYNVNGELTWIPAGIEGLALLLGAGYTTEEEDAAVIVAADYRWRWSRIDGNLGYRLEFSDMEQSWLNQADISLVWPLTADMKLSVHGLYGKENGDDHDQFFRMQAGFDWSFW